MPIFSIETATTGVSRERRAGRVCETAGRWRSKAPLPRAGGTGPGSSSAGRDPRRRSAT